MRSLENVASKEDPVLWRVIDFGGVHKLPYSTSSKESLLLGKWKLHILFSCHTEVFSVATTVAGECDRV